MNEETRNIPPIVAYARQMPDRVAYRMLPSGATVTWRELEQRSRRCAAALLAAGLRTGDVVAVFLENHPRYFELLWAAHRIGLYYTTISRHLKREEAQYIIADCDARVLFHSSHTQAELDPARLDAAGVIRISMDGAAAGAADYELAGASARGRVAAGHARGHGFPVFLRHHRPAQGHQAPIGAGQPLFPRRRGAQQRLEGLRPRHGLPVHRAVLPCRAGALEHGRAARRRQLRDAGEFDAAAALAAIAAHRVTHSQWVPTMFIRLLHMPDEERAP